MGVLRRSTRRPTHIDEARIEEATDELDPSRGQRGKEYTLIEQGLGSLTDLTQDLTTIADDSEEVVIYEEVHFEGRSQALPVGIHTLTSFDFNDRANAIQVPSGLVAYIFEHNDRGGGYGVSADLLEDCPDLSKLGLANRASYIIVFHAEDSEKGQVWTRGRIVDGEYSPGRWESTNGSDPNENLGPVASPPIPSLDSYVKSFRIQAPIGRQIAGDELDLVATATEISPPGVEISFAWRFTDGAGQEVQDVAVTGGARDASAVTFALPPTLMEMTVANFDEALESAPVSRSLGVQLVVRARLGEIQDTGPVPIPDTPLKIEIVPLPIPTVAALFRGPNLGGDAVLLMVPEESPFKSAAPIFGALQSVMNVVRRVDKAAAVTAWATGTGALLDAVTTLVETVPATTHIGFLAKNRYYDLGKYNFMDVVLWKDTDIEDRASSVLVLTANHSIHFHEHDDHKGATLGIEPSPFGAVLVRDLRVGFLASEPPSHTWSKDADGKDGTPADGVWSDNISSYIWVMV